jgi:fructokinase
MLTTLQYLLQDFRGAVPSYKVQQVGTTGPGDAFVGALLRKIVQDPSSLQVSCPQVRTSVFTVSLKFDACCLFVQDQKKLEEAIKFANACGAITATKKGAIPSLSTEADEVLQLIVKA